MRRRRAVYASPHAQDCVDNMCSVAMQVHCDRPMCLHALSTPALNNLSAVGSKLSTCSMLSPHDECTTVVCDGTLKQGSKTLKHARRLFRLR